MSPSSPSPLEVVPSAHGESRRFVLVDALRGVAAMLVVLFHVWDHNIAAITGLSLPGPIEAIVAHGNLGVSIFFVLSGFVIAHSVHAARISPGYFGRFVLRRSLRLDPPYWASIALAIATLAISSRVLHRPGIELPSLADVAANVAYLQTLLGMPDIQGVYWTLCYEVQFYLVFVFLLGLVQLFSRGTNTARIDVACAAVFTIVWILSLVVANGYLAAPAGLFIDRWFQFFAGVCAYWAFRGFIPVWALFAVLAGSLAAGHHAPSTSATIVGVSGLLFVASQSGHLWTVSGGPVMQLLGRVSYSLYLTHMIIGSRVARFGAERYPEMSLTWAVALMVVAAVASVVFAQFMYWAVERPSLRLTRLVRLSPATAPQRPDDELAQVPLDTVSCN